MASLDATRLRSFVQNLNQTDRYVVLLHYADGLSELEIAAVLQLSTVRVHTRLGELRDAMCGFIARPTQARRALPAHPLDDAEPLPAAFA